MVKCGDYKKGFTHRFGFFSKLPPKSKEKHRIWLQTVSVGKIQAIEPLLNAFNKNLEVILTITTPTAYNIALEKYANKVLAIGIFPLDFLPFLATTWNRIQPDLALLMESELWPEHLHQAKKRKVPIALINARLSNRSFNRYLKAKFLSRHLLNIFSLISTSTSPQDHKHYITLNTCAASTVLTGNLKFDVTPNKRLLSTDQKQELCRSFGFTSINGTFPLILLGSSTWLGEEIVLLERLKKALELQIDCRLLLVPRHAERRNEIADAINRYPYLWHQRSSNKKAPEKCSIHLADTTGELSVLSQVSDLAFIGKFLPPHDGRKTPIEPAALRLPLVYGPHMSNFHHACKSLEQNNAAIRCQTKEGVESTKRQSMGTAANKSWHAQNQGSTQNYSLFFQATLSK